MEPEPGAENGPFFVAIERDGQVVQTYGQVVQTCRPTTGEWGTITGFHLVPREVEHSGEPPGPLP